MKFLIINADDFGHDDGRDEAVKKLLKEKLITSTSVMVNQRNTNKAIDYINNNRLRCCGIHLTLSKGYSTYDPARRLNFNLNCKKNYLDLITEYKFYRREIESQISIANNSWDVTHLDGHLHIHVFPFFYNAIIKGMKKNKIKKIRKPYTRLGEYSKIKEPFKQYFKYVMKRNKFVLPDFFFDITYFMQNINMILKLRPDSVIEVMCHPSIDGNEDYKILTSSEYGKILSKFEKISYNDLKN